MNWLKNPLIFVVLVFIFVLVLSAFVNMQSAKAQDSSFFSDHFDGSTVDTSKWQVYEQNVDLSGSPAWGGNITVANSYLYMSSNGSAFPLIQTINNPFPSSGDFVLQFTLQYTCIADWGDGLMLGNGTPTLSPTDGTWHNKIFDVWAADKGTIMDPQTGKFVSNNQTNIYIELLNNAVYEVDYSGFKPSSPEQTYELRYINGTYSVFENGNQVAQAQSDVRPTTILVGEPAIFDLPVSPQDVATWGSWWGWTSFQLDNITVQQISNSLNTPNPIPTSNDQTQPTFSIESNSTVSSLAFNSTSEELSFTVSGPSGTTGYVNITVSKTLLPNLAGLKIYVDKQDINFTFDTVGDSQVLHFVYTHSTHQVTVSLPASVATSELQLWAHLSLLTGSSSSPIATHNGTTAQSSFVQIVYGAVAAIAIVTVVLAVLRLIINGRKAKPLQE